MEKNTISVVLGFIKGHGLIFYHGFKFIAVILANVFLQISKNINVEIENSLIISLLAFLCIDLVMFSLGYLKKIKESSSRALTKTKSLESLNHKSLDCLEKIKISSSSILDAMRIQKLDRTPTIEDIENARKSIFISGTGMSFVHTHRERLANINGNISIFLAASNHENENIKLCLNRFFGKRNRYMNLRKGLFDEIIITMKNSRRRNPDNTHIARFDFFTPVSYVAIDIDDETKPESEGSVIYAKHLLYNQNQNKTNSFYLSAFPGSLLYEKYLEQIRLIKNSGILEAWDPIAEI